MCQGRPDAIGGRQLSRCTMVKLSTIGYYRTATKGRPIFIRAVGSGRADPTVDGRAKRSGFSGKARPIMVNYSRLWVVKTLGFWFNVFWHGSIVIRSTKCLNEIYNNMYARRVMVWFYVWGVNMVIYLTRS